MLSWRISLVATPHWLLFGLANVFLGIVKANGSVNAPLAITVVALLLARVGSALGLGAAFGWAGIWWSFAAGSCAMLCLSAAYYRLGNWRGPAAAAHQAGPVRSHPAKE
jgi:Na+-driven multidrug efflux pump